MDIAIIGAGNVGRALATSFSRAGHEVDHHLARSGAMPAAVATETGTRVAASNAEAAAAADVVVLAIPFTSAEIRRGRDPRRSRRQARHRRIQPDVLRRRKVPRSIPTPPTPSASRPGCPRRTSSRRSTRSSLRTRPTRSPMASSSMASSPPMTSPPRRRSSSSCARSVSIPVDVGPLARAQQLEQLAFLNIALNITGNGDWQSGWKLVGGAVA